MIAQAMDNADLALYAPVTQDMDQMIALKY